MLKGDAIFQCLFDKECLSYTTTSIYCYEFGAASAFIILPVSLSGYLADNST